MEVGSYRLHRRAVAAFNQLDAEEQAKVLASLSWLAEAPTTEWPAAGVRRLSGDQPLYLVRVDDNWRLIVQAGEDQEPEVLDLVREETLETFANGSRNGY